MTKQLFKVECSNPNRKSYPDDTCTFNIASNNISEVAAHVAKSQWVIDSITLVCEIEVLS